MLAIKQENIFKYTTNEGKILLKTLNRRQFWIPFVGACEDPK